MIVTNTERIRCHGMASEVWGSRLISADGRRTIANKVIAEVEADPDSRDEKEIIKKIKADPEVRQFVIIPFLIMTVVGWIIEKILDYLWTLYATEYYGPQKDHQENSQTQSHRPR